MKAILFDNDGTLVDTYDMILASMRHSTRQVLGRTLPDDVLMQKVGQPLVVQMRDFTPNEDEQAAIFRAYQEHNLRIHDEKIKAFDGAAGMLAALKSAGLALGVVTSKMHATAWRGLEITGLAPYLDCCIGADDCDRYKPEPEPVERGVAALGFEVGECAYVGDSPFDIAAGNAAGCTTIGVTWGMFSQADLETVQPDYLCNSFPQLAELATSLCE